MPQHNDRVEDRQTYAGCGHVLFVSKEFARVRFDDGSEESFPLFLMEEATQGFWLVR